jgi:hypothetical protein
MNNSKPAPSAAVGKRPVLLPGPALIPRGHEHMSALHEQPRSLRNTLVWDDFHPVRKCSSGVCVPDYTPVRPLCHCLPHLACVQAARPGTGPLPVTARRRTFNAHFQLPAAFHPSSSDFLRYSQYSQAGGRQKWQSCHNSTPKGKTADSVPNRARQPQRQPPPANIGVKIRIDLRGGSSLSWLYARIVSA